MAKAFYDKNVPTRNLVTTITGVITLIVTILATVGVLTSEQATILTTQIGIAATAVTSLVGVVSSIILMFKATDA
jgi:hypothetical protein